MLLLSATLLFLIASVRATPTEELCEGYSYMYTLQPPTDTVCSPYVNDILNLTCELSGSLVDDIQWYFRPDDNENSGPVNEIKNSSEVNITYSRNNGYYTTTMVMSDLGEEDVGFYWCQGFVQHNDQSLELSMSTAFKLKARNMYFPFACPQKSHKNSDVGCAAIVPLPIASNTLLPMYTTRVPLLEPTDESTVGINPTSTVPERAPAPGPTTVTKLLPTSGPTIDNNIGGSDGPEEPPTDRKSDYTGSASTTNEPTADTPVTRDSNQLSNIILYAILGLLGCLVVLVFCLSIIISVLCCRKRHHHSLEGKNAPYDQFSTQSEAPPGSLTLKSMESYPMTPPPPPPPPYRLPIHSSNSGTLTSSSSGVYDEIHTMSPHHAPRYPLYQEIPADRVDRGVPNGHLVSAALPPPRNGAPSGEPGSNKRRVNEGHPYDLPVNKPQVKPTHTPSAQQTASSHIPNPSTVIPKHDQQNPHQPQNHNGYDSLHQVSIISTEPGDGHESVPIVSSSEFTNCNLQVTPPPDDKAVVVIAEPLTGSSFPTALQLEAAALPPTVEVVLDDDEHVLSESTISTLPAIPENPYHVLEDNQEDSHQNRGRLGLGNGVTQPHILSDVSFSEDEGYDRLVGPPHIYHILQKSPSLTRPEVRERSPVSGYHHLENRISPLKSQSSSDGKDQARCLVRLPVSFTNGDVPQSEESSMASGSEIFDDPQYHISPKRQGVTGDQLKPEQRNGHDGHVNLTERKKMDDAPPSSANLSKYRGDYERDPTYMRNLAALDTAVARGDRIGCTRSTSLPDITHTYQSLQPLTRDPLRNYEMLHRLPANV